MPLDINDPEADRLARELAELTGESITEAVTNALRERLERERRRDPQRLLREIARIQDRYRNLPLLDSRPADEILGFHEESGAG